MNTYRSIGWGSLALSVVYISQVFWIAHGCPFSVDCVPVHQHGKVFVTFSFMSLVLILFAKNMFLIDEIESLKDSKSA